LRKEQETVIFCVRKLCSQTQGSNKTVVDKKASHLRLKFRRFYCFIAVFPGQKLISIFCGLSALCILVLGCGAIAADEVKMQYVISVE